VVNRADLPLLAGLGSDRDYRPARDHVLPEAAKARAFLTDVLGLPAVDAGGGWLIFAMPPAELAVHPADGDGRHELYLMCDDIQATLAGLRDKGAEIARDVSDQGWGLLAAIRLPDGTELPIYEPRHPSPHPA
jgi:catechol 2,3-dioxygenase-like lactoylglutathione lyase family enzyme